MTYKEQWEKEHPDMPWTDEHRCPLDKYGNPIECPELRPGATCIDCWNREIPEENVDAPIPAGTDLNSIKTPGTYILDSGDRTEFATGAVRDMREGKGRCDLMPLDVAGRLLNDPVLTTIREFQETNNTQCLYRCLVYFSINFDDGRTKESSKVIEFQRKATMLLEVAKHFEEGAKKYGESNWQKGIPTHCYIDSAVRHYLKWLRGDKDEPHDRAFVWNLMCCIWEVDYSPRAKEESDENH